MIGSTKPRPRKCAHTRFTSAFANQGFAGEVIQAASAARGLAAAERSVPSSAVGFASAMALISGSFRRFFITTEPASLTSTRRRLPMAGGSMGSIRVSA